MVKELENCVESLQNAINLHLRLSCSSSSHSKECQSLRNARSTINQLADAASNHRPSIRRSFQNDEDNEKDEQLDNGFENIFTSPFLIGMSYLTQGGENQQKKLKAIYNRTKSFPTWNDLNSLKEKSTDGYQNLKEMAISKYAASRSTSELCNERYFQDALFAVLTIKGTPERKISESYCEILQVAQVNLDNAILAVKQYEIVAWNIGSVMNVETKMIVTKARELSRTSDVFDKMTEDALTKLSTLTTEDDSDNAYVSDNE